MSFMEVLMSALSLSRFHQLPDAMWKRVDLLIPLYAKSPNGGRPRLRMRNVVVGIFYVLATGFRPVEGALRRAPAVARGPLFSSCPRTEHPVLSSLYSCFREGNEWGTGGGENCYGRGLIN